MKLYRSIFIFLLGAIFALVLSVIFVMPRFSIFTEQIILFNQLANLESIRAYTNAELLNSKNKKEYGKVLLKQLCKKVRELQKDNEVFVENGNQIENPDIAEYSKLVVKKYKILANDLNVDVNC